MAVPVGWFRAKIADSWNASSGPMPLKIEAMIDDGTGQPLYNGYADVSMVNAMYGTVASLYDVNGNQISGFRVQLTSGAWQGKVMMNVINQYPGKPLGVAVLMLGFSNVDDHVGGASTQVEWTNASSIPTVTSLVIQMPSIVVRDQSQVVTVQALDQLKQPIAYNGYLAFTSTDPAAKLPFPGPMTSGVATFSVRFGTLGPCKLTVRDLSSASLAGSKDVIVQAPVIDAVADHMMLLDHESRIKALENK